MGVPCVLCYGNFSTAIASRKIARVVLSAVCGLVSNCQGEHRTSEIQGVALGNKDVVPERRGGVGFRCRQVRSYAARCGGRLDVAAYGHAERGFRSVRYRTDAAYIRIYFRMAQAVAHRQIFQLTPAF